MKEVVEMGKGVMQINVRFDKISLGAAQQIRENGGRLLPVGNGRYQFFPPNRCRWGGPPILPTLKLPNGVKVRCRPHDETVELLLDTEYLAGK